MLTKKALALAGTTNWTSRGMPQMTGMKAFVLPGAFYGAVNALMAEGGYTRAVTVEDADVIVFIGGDDINPKLYGDKALACTHFDEERDTVEEFFYKKALSLRKPMFGICRGAQFLHAMNGGELWQDVRGHGGTDHMIVDIEEDKRVLSTSIHHQMLKPSPEMTLIAVTEEKVSNYFRDGTSTLTLGENTHEVEVEAGCYEDTRCFFVQGHPEIGSSEYRSWCMTKLQEFIRDLAPFNTITETILEKIG